MLLEKPILQSLQVHRVVLRVSADEVIEVDLANRAPVGAHLWLQAVRQLNLCQSFQGLLAIPIVDGLVVEDKHYAGQTEDRHRSQMLQMRDSVHLDFNGDCYL